MELHTEEEWVHVFRELGDLAEIAAWRFAGEYEAGFFKLLHVFWIHFVAMTVTFDDILCAVRRGGNGCLREFRRVVAEAHGVSIGLVFEFLHLVSHREHHRKRRLRIHFHRMRTLHSRLAARVFHHHELHTVADAEVWDFLFACKLNGFQNTVDTTLSKTTRHENTIELRKFFYRLRIFFIFFRINPRKHRLYIFVVSRIFDRLDD